jgi:hypothetical protein
MAVSNGVNDPIEFDERMAHDFVAGPASLSWWSAAAGISTVKHQFE